MTAQISTPPSLTEVAKPRQRVFLEQSLAERIAGALWALVWVTLFRCSPEPLHGWRTMLLRSSAPKSRRRPGSRPPRILFPWNLRLGTNVFIAHQVIINCMGEVRIGDRTRISQYAHIVAGTHAYQRPDMRIVRSPITIGSDVWIAADAFVGPGVTIGDRCLLAARASAFHDLPEGQICVGEPAHPIKPRSPEEVHE